MVKNSLVILSEDFISVFEFFLSLLNLAVLSDELQIVAEVFIRLKRYLSMMLLHI